MNSDRELLELAAKAAGIHIDKSTTNGGGMGNTGFDLMGNAKLDCHNGTTWNPLTDDGDALRLAVKLGMHLQFDHEELKTIYVFTESPITSHQPSGDDPYAATRRAIVCAAAEIGKVKP